MANKKISTGKLDLDVQRFRDESNWRKVIELAEQHNAKLGKNGNQNICYISIDIPLSFQFLENLIMFLLGEAKLELYLEEHPPYDQQAEKAKVGLMEAKRLLLSSANNEGTKNTASMDAQLLLAKLHFACGERSCCFKKLINHDNVLICR